MMCEFTADFIVWYLVPAFMFVVGLPVLVLYIHLRGEPIDE